ncbi:MAG: NosD domain-containing protein, partial [bacterium]
GPGIYNENVNSNMNLGAQSLEGLKLESTAGRYATIINAPNTSASVIRVWQSKVQIGKKGKGFTVTGATGRFGIEIATANASRCKIEGNRATANQYGFFLQGERIQVRNNIAKGNSSSGIQCNLCNQGLIRENHVTDSGIEGLAITNSAQATVERNIASENVGVAIVIGGDSARVRDNVAELSTAGDGILMADIDGALIQGNIAARSGGVSPGFRLVQSNYNNPPQVKSNLAVGNVSDGFRLSGLLNAKVDGNTAVGNTDDGINIISGTTVSSLKTNNTYDNDTAAIFSCGIRNDSGNSVTYTKHFFGGGDTVCGAIVPTGTFATKPSPLKVKVAASL